MKKFIVFAALAAAASLHAEVVFEVKAVSDLNLPDRVTATGEKQFKVKKHSWFTSAKAQTLDTAKSYRIQGEFRIAPDAKVTKKFSIGFYSTDASGRIIDVADVCVQPDTETELAAPVKKGDKVFKVKDASKWVKQAAYIAFDVDPSGKMRDLPSRTIHNARITKITKNGDVWEIETAAPIRTDYAEGTAVREHRGGWSFLCCDNTVPTAEWQKISWTVKSGEAKKNTRTQWLFGAKKFVIVMVLPDGMEFRNVTVEKLD